MRVLHISDFFHPTRGGIERVALESCLGLARRGIEVAVLTRLVDPGSPAYEVVHGIPVWRVGPPPGPLPLLYVGLRSAARRWAATHLPRFDLVHSHQNLLVHTLLRELAQRRLPLVATFYGPWAEEYRLEMADPVVPSRWPSLVRRLAVPAVAQSLRSMQRSVVTAARRRVVLSHASIADLTRLMGAEPPSVDLVPGGVDVDRFVPRPTDEARRRLGLDDLGSPLLVAVRRLVPRMGLRILIEAVALLQEPWPTLALALAGTGPLADHLRQAARDRGLEHRVRLLGAISDDDLAWLYSASDLTVLPTRALEGFGLPVLEAWATGRPVVATGSGALPETVAQLDPGLVAPQATPQSIAAAIDRGLRLRSAALSERARSLALSYSWDHVTAELAGVYDRALRA